MRNRPSYMWIGLLLAVLLLASGCVQRLQGVEVGEEQTVTQTVELGGADEVNVHLIMGAGQLNVGSSVSGSNLLDASFTFNVEGWQPEVAYETRDNVGYLTVTQPSQEEINVPLRSMDDITYRWDLNLNDTVPMEMTIDLGAGENNLDLSGLNLRDLALQTGAGQVGVSVPDTLSDLQINMGVGSLDVDLTGDWQQDLDARVRGGLGELTLRLPANVGVRVDVNQGLGEVDSPGLTQDGGYLVNDAYGESDITLDIRVDGGVGQITLQVVE